MQFGIAVGGELEMKLDQAILLYRSDGYRHMATVHSVVQKAPDGAPVLGAGALLTTATLRKLSRELGTSSVVEVLPDYVVARTPELLAWWRPAATRRMFFRAESELAELSGRPFPHPSLLFVVREGGLYVRALFKSCRPGADTELAAAPYWNVGSDGGVCAGTMGAPNENSVASIAGWEAAFWQSEFTHPGGGGKVTKARGGTTALWKRLAGKQRFPTKTLLETETLAEYLRKIES